MRPTSWSKCTARGSGYGARVALEHHDAVAALAEERGEHAADRPAADDRDVATMAAHRLVSVVPDPTSPSTIADRTIRYPVDVLIDPISLPPCPRPPAPPPQRGRDPRPSADVTRERILDAALDLFADRSFDGASTRDIAARARRVPAVAQLPLPAARTTLWRAAVDRLFAELERASLRDRLDGLRGVDAVTTAKLVIRDFIAFSAAHPQLHRIITQESKGEGGGSTGSSTSTSGRSTS